MKETDEAAAAPGVRSGDAGGQAPGQSRLLEIIGLSRSFGETRALVTATLSIGQGEIHALAGENGSGKTTLIKILSGVLRADSGEIRWDGKALRLPNPAAAQALGISTVYQETLVAPELSVLHNIFAGTDGLLRRRRSAEAEYELAAATLAELGMNQVSLDRPVWALTLAERQMVTIARAIVRPWQLLILDEATSALDADQRDRLFAYLRRAKAASRSILFTSHRMDEVEALADTVSVLRMGSTAGHRQMAETTPREILSLMANPEEVAAALDERPARAADKPTATGEPVLRVTGLHLAPGVSPVTLTVGQGEILGLAGLEGQGQVEFAQALCGMHGHVAGTVEVAGKAGQWHPVRHPRDAQRHKVAFVPRERKLEGLFFPLSILDNFGLALFGHLNVLGLIRWRAIRRRYAETAARMHLTARRPSALVGVLSGGNQQKVLLGRWLATQPRVLVLIDPLRGIDANTKQELYGLFRGLAAEGLSIVLVSTEILELLTLSDRIGVFHRQGLHELRPAEGWTEAQLIAALFGEGGAQA